MSGRSAGAADQTGGNGTPAVARSIVGRIMGVIRRIAGMPDYAAHLEHLRRCHPGRAVPTEKEFFEEYLRSRYGSGVSRCC